MARVFGNEFALNNALNLDLYAGLNFTQIGSESAQIWGSDVEFERINSLKSKLGARLDYDVSAKFELFASAAWEHEFGGKAKGTVKGKNVVAPSLKGNTGVGEIGAKFSNGGFGGELFVRGLTGKKEGINGGISLKYEF